jgi:uncharacterized membrane protein
MGRKFKMLGATLVAVLAVGAAAAPAASAAEFHSESETTFLTGIQAKENIFTFSGGTFKCKFAGLDGEYMGKTQLTYTVSPTYADCSAFGQSVVLDMNECHFGYGASTAVSPPVHYEGKAQIACPEGKQIVITVGSPTVQCTIKIGSQTPSGSTDYTNEGSGGSRNILVTSTTTGIVYTSSGGICGKSGAASTYTGSTTFKGYADAAHTQQTGIWVE